MYYTVIGFSIILQDYIYFITEVQPEEPFILFRVTFMYYTLMRFSITLSVCTIVSLLTESPNVEELNPILFSLVARKCVFRKNEKYRMKIIYAKKVNNE
jgi:hypothetical protein